MTQADHVVLVDQQGNVSGQQEKLAAHRAGQLHQAFSIMLYRPSTANGYDYLLQRRAHCKYHSGGLWTNTCCSHPRFGEALRDACVRRLREELGINQPLDMQEVDVFCYYAQLDNNLIEHERDHVWLATTDETLIIAANPEEVMDYRWWSEAEIMQALDANPKQFTAWFGEVFQRVCTATAQG